MGCTVFLQHSKAAQFFREAMRPDLEELRRRDAFFAKLEAETPLRIEGKSIVMDIPDVDITALMEVKHEG